MVIIPALYLVVQVYNPAEILCVGRHGVPAALLHDADHVALGARIAPQVRAAVLPASRRPHCVGQETAAGLRHLEWRWHVRARSQDLWRLYVLRSYRRADAA